MKKFAVILAGCGVYDGAEIHEAVLTLLAIDRMGGTYDIFAPDIAQAQVINHLTGQPMDEQRNVLTESARIARGKIRNLIDFDHQQFDALVFPGGFGVAKNLCSFAFQGADCTVNPLVEKAILDMHRTSKPIGALCISPVMVAKVLKKTVVTIGNDATTMSALSEMGATPKEAGVNEVVVDRTNKVVTTPCYMLDVTIKQIADGAENLVAEIYRLF
jgi:enhancing lycopene biosynthesis protein 2